MDNASYHDVDAHLYSVSVSCVIANLSDNSGGVGTFCSGYAGPSSTGITSKYI